MFRNALVASDDRSRFGDSLLFSDVVVESLIDDPPPPCPLQSPPHGGFLIHRATWKVVGRSESIFFSIYLQ